MLFKGVYPAMLDAKKGFANRLSVSDGDPGTHTC